jgi:hypothetical protein
MYHYDMVNNCGAQTMQASKVSETATFNWSHALKTIRAFVLARIKTDKDTLAYIKIEMMETDTFHDYASMDALYGRLTDSVDYRIWDALYEAIHRMGELITEHFEDPWNFAPGYVKPKKLIVPDSEKLSAATLDKLLKEAAPQVHADMKQHEKEQKAAQLAIRKAEAAEISDKRVVELATLYKAQLLGSCNKAVKGFKKKVWPDDVWYFEMTEEQLKGFKDGVEFLAALEAKFVGPAALFDKCFEMVTCSKAFTPSRFGDALALWRDKKGRKRLLAAVCA